MQRRAKKLRVSFGPATQRQRQWAVIGGVALLVWLVFGGNKGLVAAAQTWWDTRNLREEIETLKAANQALAERKKHLQDDPRLYEKVAREDLALAKPGELIYRFDTPD